MNQKAAIIVAFYDCVVLAMFTCFKFLVKFIDFLAEPEQFTLGCFLYSENESFSTNISLILGCLQMTGFLPAG
jgi:hypothetical protein